VDKWEHLNGTDLLRLIYQDPRRWALTQQSYVQMTMLEEHLRQIGKAKVLERSVHTGRVVFAEHFVRTGDLSPTEAFILDNWYNLILAVPEFDVQSDLTGTHKRK